MENKQRQELAGDVSGLTVVVDKMEDKELVKNQGLVMLVTHVYKQNLSAWLAGYRIIANKGGTRSGKTYSLMSLFVTVAAANRKQRTIDVVSESLPH